MCVWWSAIVYFVFPIFFTVDIDGLFLPVVAVYACQSSNSSSPLNWKEWLFSGTPTRCLTSHPGQLSLAIPAWVRALSTGGISPQIWEKQRVPRNSYHMQWCSRGEMCLLLTEPAVRSTWIVMVNWLKAISTNSLVGTHLQRRGPPTYWLTVLSTGQPPLTGIIRTAVSYSNIIIIISYLLTYLLNFSVNGGSGPVHYLEWGRTPTL